MEYLRVAAEDLNSGNKSLQQLGRELGLNNEQIAFCEAYVSDECRGNGKKAASIGYGYDLTTPQGKSNAYNTANRNLKHPQVNLLISILLDTVGLNDEFVDIRLKELITQDADIKTTIMAISEYNRIRGRQKQVIEVIQKPILDNSVYSVEELQLLIQLMEKGLIRGQETQHIPLLEG